MSTAADDGGTAAPPHARGAAPHEALLPASSAQQQRQQRQQRRAAFQVVLIRHGESQWNLQNRFTGWTDVDLTLQGRLQAMRAGAVLRAAGFAFDEAYTSVLLRAVRTLHLTLDQMGLMHIPEAKAYELNERHYGALQGLNKAETAEKHGAEQVLLWRRSYTTRPPPLERSDPRHPRFDLRYRGLPEEALPDTESLQDCVKRCLPYWRKAIAPAISRGRRVVVAAHGNSLRGIVKHLDSISDEDIMKLEIPTALVYELDEHLAPLQHYYLAAGLLAAPPLQVAVLAEQPGGPVAGLEQLLAQALLHTGVTDVTHLLLAEGPAAAEPAGIGAGSGAASNAAPGGAVLLAGAAEAEAEPGAGGVAPVLLQRAPLADALARSRVVVVVVSAGCGAGQGQGGGHAQANADIAPLQGELQRLRPLLVAGRHVVVVVDADGAAGGVPGLERLAGAAASAVGSGVGVVAVGTEGAPVRELLAATVQQEGPKAVPSSRGARRGEAVRAAAWAAGGVSAAEAEVVAHAMSACLGVIVAVPAAAGAVHDAV